jgi:TetR/AcrR family transcriptional regulator, mexJK operon transcriptional repressor
MPRKDVVIVATARRLFLERGYDGTSLDDVAAASGVSKTTVYNNFEDKQALFTAVVMEVTARAGAIIDELADLLAASDRPVSDRLAGAGRRLARGALNPAVVQLRRIAVSEAVRFPRLVEEYWSRGPGRTIEVLQDALARMDDAGELAVPETHHAALHFAYALLGPYQDQALLRPGEAIDDTELDRHVEETVARFVRAYAATDD